MCGITGAVWTNPALAVDTGTLSRMTGVLAHRGPDDTGMHRSDLRIRAPYPTLPGAALGHRRLAIIDPAENRQPISNEDGTIWLVFNGEVYNYRELRQRLEGAGHRFRTRGDSETLVHLYEDEGPEFVRHVNGMFGLALWDENRQRLVLARDRLGQKPLVYRVESERVLFASELKSLLQVPGVPRKIDHGALDEYLTLQYVPYPNTIFQGFRKLPPAHVGVFEKGRLKVTPYWTPDFGRERPLPRAEAIETVRRELTRSVELRMQSDVPLGAFLSGGVDSSIIVALMQRLAGEPVKTFSIGFPVAEYDESAHAADVARHLGTDHHTFQVEPHAMDVLSQLVWHYDEPFADSSAVPTWYVSRLTREHVKVALTGDGGDELFAGYPRYRAVRLTNWTDRLPGPLRRLLASPLWQRLPSAARQKNVLRRAKRLLAGVDLEPTRRYGLWVAIFDEARRAALYEDDFLRSLPDSDPLDFLVAASRRAKGRDPVTVASLTDLVTYLPCDLMTKVDIASMAHGLECRQPFLDPELVETAIGLPVGMKLRGRQGKWILRKAFGDLLPKGVFTRPKMGFGVPLDHWFRGELAEPARDILLDPVSLGRGYFRPAIVRRLIEEHTSGRFDHQYRLWALLVLEMWHREWVDGDPAKAAVETASA